MQSHSITLLACRRFSQLPEDNLREMIVRPGTSADTGLCQVMKVPPLCPEVGTHLSWTLVTLIGTALLSCGLKSCTSGLDLQTHTLMAPGPTSLNKRHAPLYQVTSPRHCTQQLQATQRTLAPSTDRPTFRHQRPAHWSSFVPHSLSNRAQLGLIGTFAGN